MSVTRKSLIFRKKCNKMFDFENIDNNFDLIHDKADKPITK